MACVSNIGKLVLRNSTCLIRFYRHLGSRHTSLNNNDNGNVIKIQKLVSVDDGMETSTNSGTEILFKNLITPPIQTGMKILNRMAFTKQITVPSIAVQGSNIQYIIRYLKPYLLKIRGIKPTIGDDGESEAQRKILLNPELVPDMDEFIQTMKTKLSLQFPISHSPYPLTLTYENFSHDQITNSILPDGTEKFGGFTQTGHVIQLNLRDHNLPYKNIIGQVLLDKIPNTKTIVNKTNMIENEYRNFQMEILAGENNTVVKLKENQCEFQFEFRTVYWNSRLSSEHERIVEMLRKGDVLFDVFAGVGPFAIPAAKNKKCYVLANDLNPDSAKWLQKNVTINKVMDFVQVFNKDGGDFIKEDVAGYLKKKFVSDFDENSTNSGDGEILPPRSYHVTMNLPAISVEFLPCFWNLLGNVCIPSDFKLRVYVYCFVKGVENMKEKAVKLVVDNLQYELGDRDDVGVYNVRIVAPNKEMYRVTFNVPNFVLSNVLPVGVKRKIDEV